MFSYLSTAKNQALKTTWFYLFPTIPLRGGVRVGQASLVKHFIPQLPVPGFWGG